MVSLDEIAWAYPCTEEPPTQLVLQTSARVAPVPALAGAVSGTRVYLVVPAGSLPNGRFRARAGPLHRRKPAVFTLFEEAEQAELLDDVGDPLTVAVDVIEASLLVLDSCGLSEDGVGFVPDHPGAWPAAYEVAEFLKSSFPDLATLDIPDNDDDAHTAMSGQVSVEDVSARAPGGLPELALPGAARGGGLAELPGGGLPEPLGQALPGAALGGEHFPGQALPGAAAGGGHFLGQALPGAAAGGGHVGLDPGLLEWLQQLRQVMPAPSSASVLPGRALAGAPAPRPAAPPVAAPPGLLGAYPKVSPPVPLGSASAGRFAPRQPPPVPGLDPAVVAQALQAGIPLEDLSAFGNLAGSRPPRVVERPGGGPHGRSGARDALEARAEEEATAFRDPPGEPPGEPSLAAVLARLTDLVEGQRAGGPVRPQLSHLERALEGVGASGPEGWGSALSVRKGAAARQALIRALREDPGHFSDFFDRAALAAVDDQGRSSQDVEPALSRGHARRYMERRAALGNHRPSTQWLWMIAGAYDALVRGAVPEARARLALAMVAGEQACMEGGSWLMARELLLEDEPPFGPIAARGIDTRERPHPATCDPRWAEVAHARLRDLDDWRERRRRLMAQDRPPAHPPAGPRAEAADGEEAAAISRRAAAKAKALAARQAAAAAKAAEAAKAGAPARG